MPKFYHFRMAKLTLTNFREYIKYLFHKSNNSATWLKTCRDFIKSPNLASEELIHAATGGLMNGYFTSFEVNLLVRFFNKEYPQYVSGLYKIGESFLGKPIVAFSLGRLQGKINQKLPTPNSSKPKKKRSNPKLKMRKTRTLIPWTALFQNF